MKSNHATSNLPLKTHQIICGEIFINFISWVVFRRWKLECTWNHVSFIHVCITCFWELVCWFLRLELKKKDHENFIPTHSYQNPNPDVCWKPWQASKMDHFEKIVSNKGFPIHLWYLIIHCSLGRSMWHKMNDERWRSSRVLYT